MIYIGLDDTDNVASRGTGRLARAIAAALSDRYCVQGVTRHQLLFDPRVPYTSHNSSAALHLAENGSVDLEALADEVQGLMLGDFQAGSDPGLCVARVVSAGVVDFGRRAQTQLVCQAEAYTVAGDAGCVLRGLGGTCDGVIGALSAVGLASTGDDGRFIAVGTARQLAGAQPVPAVLAAGISEVRCLDGTPVAEGLVDTGGKLRPALRGGRAVLFVEPNDDGRPWRAVKV